MSKATRSLRSKTNANTGEGREHRESLRRTESDFRSLVENVYDHAIFSLDIRGRIAGWNAGAARVFGYTEDEIMGEPFSAIFTPEDIARNEPEKELKRAEDAGRTADRRWHVRKNGTRFWCDGVVTAIKDEGGRLRGFTKLARDTTERRQAEEERRSEERFQIVARATNDAIWDWNLRTEEIWWNEGVQTMFGYTPEQVGQYAAWWYEHIHPDDRERVRTGIHSVVNFGGQSWSDEYAFARADGSYAYVFDRGYVMQDADGKPIRMLGAMMDITERKRAEQERSESLAREQQARAEAEKANKVKDEFLAMVSHELRTPLTTIKTATRLLRRNKLDESERRECINTIGIECDRQIDLVLNLLDLSRVEVGALNLQPAPVEVSEVLKSCYELERQAAELNKHQLELELPAEPLLPVRADAKALRRALCGLVENAIKYTSEGGTITLRARTSSSTGTGDEVAISITDTGRGIAPEDLPHVFEKYYRGRSTRPTTPEAPAEGEEEHSDPNTPGVGLGLYLASTIVQQLGGRIIVESAVGEGSTFTVYLPVWQDEEEERSVKEADDETVAIG